MAKWEKVVSGGVAFGEVRAPSLAVAELEVWIAWSDIDTASEPEELTESFLVWWEARQVLREVLIGAGR